MSGTSAAGILVMVAVIVLGLATWLVLVFWANRHPRFKGRRPKTGPGDVRGGTFLGGGGSVMPHRDAPPDPGREWPAESSGEPADPEDAKR